MLMYKVFISVLETFMVFGVGAVAYKLKMIDQQDVGKLSRLCLEFFFPLLTFATITRNFTRANLSDLWLMPLLGLSIMVIGAVLGMFFKRFMRHPTPERSGTFHHICAINNYVFLPIIVLQNVFTERNVGLLLVMNVGFTFGFWTIGVMTFTGVPSVKAVVKSLCSINILAVVLAVLIVLSGLTVPEPIAYTCKYLGDITVPLMLIIIGVALTQSLKTLHHYKFDMIYLAVVRLIVIPVVIMLIFRLLPLDKEVYETVAVVALMPAASSSVLIARQYGGCADMAGQAIVVTTLLSLITMPLLLKVFL